MDIEQRIARIDNALNDVKFEVYPEIIHDNSFDKLVGVLHDELRGLQWLCRLLMPCVNK